MGTEMVSARFETKDTKFIEEVAIEEKTDRTAALKKIFSMGAKQYRLEKAVEQYQKGKIGLGGAAEKAGISLWEMMEELKGRNISSPLSEEEFSEGLKNLKKAWK